VQGHSRTLRSDEQKRQEEDGEGWCVPEPLGVAARDIVGALTTQVLCQFLQVWQLLHDVNLNPLQTDRFVWKWSPDGKYSASSAYHAFFAGSTSLLGGKGTMQDEGATQSKIFLLVSPTS
jgi:hypothetical protein